MRNVMVKEWLIKSLLIWIANKWGATNPFLFTRRALSSFSRWAIYSFKQYPIYHFINQYKFLELLKGRYNSGAGVRFMACSFLKMLIVLIYRFTFLIEKVEINCVKISFWDVSRLCEGRYCTLITTVLQAPGHRCFLVLNINTNNISSLNISTLNK